jgi:hypothetical protein
MEQLKLLPVKLMDCQKRWLFISVFVTNLFCFCVPGNLGLYNKLTSKGLERIIYHLLAYQGRFYLKITFEASTFHLFLKHQMGMKESFAEELDWSTH